MARTMRCEAPGCQKRATCSVPGRVLCQPHFDVATDKAPRHRDAFPEQYRHPLVGKRVRVKSSSGAAVPVEGIVRRVMATRFGPLADLGTRGQDGAMLAYSVGDCEVIG
jgi:hypothetical protein